MGRYGHLCMAVPDEAAVEGGEFRLFESLLATGLPAHKQSFGSGGGQRRASPPVTKPPPEPALSGDG